jgi:hypothetical protein
MPSMKWYRQARLAAWQGSIDWASDTIVVTQHTSAYTPNPDTDAYVSNLTGEVASGSGYTTGGIALSSKSVVYSTANGWAYGWAPVTSYSVGQVVRPAIGNGQLFECVAAGTSGSSAPAWPSYGLTVTDGSATWGAAGAGVVTWNAQNIQWPAYSGSFRYLVVSDRQSGVPSSEPLLGYLDLGSMNTGSGGNLDVAWSPALLLDLVP